MQHTFKWNNLHKATDLKITLSEFVDQLNIWTPAVCQALH